MRTLEQALANAAKWRDKIETLSRFNRELFEIRLDTLTGVDLVVLADKIESQRLEIIQLNEELNKLGK